MCPGDSQAGTQTNIVYQYSQQTEGVNNLNVLRLMSGLTKCGIHLQQNITQP